MFITLDQVIPIVVINRILFAGCFLQTHEHRCGTASVPRDGQCIIRRSKVPDQTVYSLDKWYTVLQSPSIIMLARNDTQQPTTNGRATGFSFDRLRQPHPAYETTRSRQNPTAPLFFNIVPDKHSIHDDTQPINAAANQVLLAAAVAAEKSRAGRFFQRLARSATTA